MTGTRVYTKQNPPHGRRAIMRAVGIISFRMVPLAGIERIFYPEDIIRNF
jgi:hypothetical protein